MSSLPDADLETALQHDQAQRQPDGSAPFDNRVVDYLEGKQMFAAKQTIQDLIAMARTAISQAHAALISQRPHDAQVGLDMAKEILDLATKADIIGDRALVRKPG